MRDRTSGWRRWRWLHRRWCLRRGGAGWFSGRHRPIAVLRRPSHAAAVAASSTGGRRALLQKARAGPFGFYRVRGDGRSQLSGIGDKSGTIWGKLGDKGVKKLGIEEEQLTLELNEQSWREREAKRHVQTVH